MPAKRLALVLALALFALPSLAAVTGTVMTAEGKPLPGARVSLYAPESAEARRARLLSATPEAVPLASTQADSKGAFTLESPKAAVVELRAFLRGYQPLGRVIERDEEVGAVILPKLEMRNATVTSGGGKAVAGATVVVSYPSEYLTKTDEQGRYEAPDPKRATSVLVLHPDFAIDEEGLFSMTGVAASKLNRTLAKGTTVTGTVLAADGQTPVAKATILLDQWPVATSGDDGTFTIARAPSRWGTLTARKESLIAQRTFTADKAPLKLKLEKGAVFSGRVTDAKTKVPVAGASVRLGVRRFDPRSTDQSLSTTTDGKGGYSFVAAPGSYTVNASHPSYDLDYLEVSAASGQTANKDLSIQPLARLSGMVVDESNKPIAAASVAGEDVNAGFGPRMMMFRGDSSAASGPDGRFSMRIGGERELRLRATKRGLPAGRSDTVRVANGERKSGIVITVPSGIAVSGVVTDANGDPLSGVSVTASETPGRAGSGAVQQRFIMMGGPQREEDAVQSATDGTFTLRVKEGTYDFTFRREGFAAKTVRAHPVSATNAPPVETKLDPAVEIAGRVTRGGVGIDGVSIFAFGSGESNAVTGADGSFTLGGLSPGSVRMSLRKEDAFINEQRTFSAPSRDVTIELPVGGRVSGRVVEKGSRRAITSFQAGLSTSRSGGGMVMMGPPQLRSFTSEDGSFTLENVPPGSTTVVANAPGYVGAKLNVTVEEGKPVEDLVLELDTGVKLAGRVTSPTGTPLSDVSVRVMPSPTGGFAMGSERRTTTDANGEYTLEALDPGDETISFSHAKYLATSKPVTLKGREMRLDAQLEGGTRVIGTVVTENGTPVADAEVRAFGSGSSTRGAQTNASGSFEFESLAPARYRFSANRSGYAEGVVEDFDIASGAPLRIVLKTGGTLYGRVSGLSEQEIANTYVQARSGGQTVQTPVDATGNFRLEGAPVGTVLVLASVRALNASRTTAVQTVELSAGSAVQVDLQFSSDTVVRGRVTRNNVPLAGATVIFSPRGTTASNATATTDQDGNYSVTGIENGNYNVTVVDTQRYSPYSTLHEVRGSETFNIDYRTAALRGRVIDVANNRPLSGAGVQLKATSGTEIFRGRGAVSDENGVFTIDSVPAGTYSVTASLDEYGNDIKTVTVTESGSEELELKLARNEGIVFKVVDARNNRPISAVAAVFDAQGRQVAEPRFVWFGDGGSTASDLKVPLAPGSYVATVTANDYAPVTINVTAPSTRNIALTPGGRLELSSKHSERRRVQLVDAGGNIYPRMDLQPRRTVLHPRPGKTPLAHIAPGTYTLQLLSEDETTVVDQVQVTVLEGQVTPAEI